MEGRAPVSVAAGDSGDLPLVSPPPMDAEDPALASGVSELVAATSAGPVQASQATIWASRQSTTDTTPSGSPARLTAASVTQHGQQQASSAHEQPMTPETASSERSASDGVPTPTESEKGAKATPSAGNRDPNGAKTAADTTQNGSDQSATQQDEQVGTAAGQEAGDAATHSSAAGTEEKGAQASEHKKKKDKLWFELLPMVLHNFKVHDREQIRQLTLPRCELCERSKVDRKAELKCNQEDCLLFSRWLCSPCWQSTHSSDGAQKHRRLPALICQQCQLERIAYWCAECDLKFCVDCFEQIHSVPRTKSHRKLATEDAPGTCLAKSHWSANFHSVIFQMIAARRHRPSASNGSSGDSVGEKRKRDIEVIVIDDEEESENEASTQANVSLTNGTSEQQTRNGGLAVNQPSSDVAVAGNAGALYQLQTPQQAASASMLFQAPVAQHSMLEPIPFPQESTETTSTPLTLPARFEAVQTSSAYNVPTTTNGANSINIVGNLQWNGSADQFGDPSSMGTGTSSAGFATSVMSNGMMQLPPTSMPTAVNTMSGVWSTTSTVSTDLASTSNPTNLLPLGGAVFAENALVDSLVDRYHEVNQNVTNMELQSEQLTRQIAVATCQGPYAAGSIMVMLSKLQPVLEAARARRDKLFIAMVIQSNDTMASVRLLRLAELGDVPQVPMISHRKCLQISNEINQHKKKLIELNQQLSETLNQSHEVSSSWENTLIRTTSSNIQMHEKTIKKLKKDREVEIVRVVQFSRNIREALKQAFQRSVEVQRQQQQQQQF